MRHMRYLLGTFALFVGLFAGCFAAFNSLQGTFYVSNSRYISVRNPALVQKLTAYSELKGKAWNLLSRDRLLSEAFPIKEEKRTGFVFGHFITQDAEGKKYFACDLYDKIQLSFIADGVVEGGEFTRMKVEAPCHASKDLNTLEPVWIPSPSSASEPSAVKISYSNLPSEMPREWVLEEIQLSHDSKVGISVHPKRPMTISW